MCLFIGGLSAEYEAIKLVFDIAKKCSCDIITIGGGGGFSSEPILFAEMCGVDYACIGEGEVTICELIKYIFTHGIISNVKGVVWKNDYGKYVYNGARDYIEDLDTIAFPDYDEMDMEAYLSNQTSYDYYWTYSDDEPRQIPIFLGRSCPFQCNFCYHPLGNKYRQRSLSNFFLELDNLLSTYNINSLLIFDELFALKRDKILEFCERIKSYNLTWNIQLRVNIVDKELLRIMREAGCRSISYGIESFNKKVLKNMNKHICPDDIERALQMTYDAGICIQGNFIFGDEEENIETFSETLAWWRKHRKYNLNLAFIETYPGTQLYKNSVARGLIDDKRKFIELNAPIINMSKMSDREFEKVRNLIVLEEFTDSGFAGKVIRISNAEEETEKFVELEVECAHCGKRNIYKRIERKRIYSNHFKIPCRSCGQRSVYDTRLAMGIRDSDYKYKMYFYMLRQIELNDESHFATFFAKYDAITIFYDDELGEIALKQVKKVCVKNIIDPKKENRYRSVSDKYECVSIEGFFNEYKERQLLNHAILVCDVYNYSVIKKDLKERGYLGDVISFMDAIMDIRTISE